MQINHLVPIGLLLTVLTACSAPAPVDHAARVAALVEEAWQHQIAGSVYLQVRQGRLIGELPDLTPEQNARDIEFARSLKDRLGALPVAELAHEDALTVAILDWDADLVLDAEPFYWLNFPYTPYVASFGFNFVHQQLAAHPFDEVVAHPQNYLRVLDEYAQNLGQLRAHIEGQVERGIYVSRHALPGIVSMFESLEAGALDSMTVSGDRLGALDEDQRVDFEAAVAERLRASVLPAFDSLLEVLRSEEYLAQAPDSVGLTQYPGGDAYYRYLVRAHTTTEVTPAELHELGLRRVNELEEKMTAIRDGLSFGGSREEFHQRLRTDPQFFASSPQEVEAKFEEYIARIEPMVPEYFRTLPQAPYGVERLNPAAEASMTFGYYAPPTPTEPVGRYHYNGSQLDERPQIWAGPLIYHELVPGHHFHIASQNENRNLPMYRRESFSATAYVEGWGNYGALLASEMGLLDDPYDQYGAALFDMFISSRLVLDTGMNQLGWTLEEGRAFMAEHTFQSETEIATETLRYSTDLFGQALAYKAGLERLVELRQRARDLAGESFDIRDFHDAVLGSGSMPMTVLEGHIEWFFERGSDEQAPRVKG